MSFGVQGLRFVTFEFGGSEIFGLGVFAFEFGCFREGGLGHLFYRSSR